MKNAFFIAFGWTLYFISAFAWAETPRFERKEGASNDWIVVDNTTSLEWQGCPLGLTGQDCSHGEIEELTWQEALEGCENLGYGSHDDWRLPNLQELGSIVDDRRERPSIDTSNFPNTPNSSAFWSSCSYAGGSSIAWSILFRDGTVGYYGKTSTYCVRCVRGGP
jgi:hypothetical protein